MISVWSEGLFGYKKTTWLVDGAEVTINLSGQENLSRFSRSAI
jgi:hypothetical protein